MLTATLDFWKRSPKGGGRGEVGGVGSGGGGGGTGEKTNKPQTDKETDKNGGIIHPGDVWKTGTVVVTLPDAWRQGVPA